VGGEIEEEKTIALLLSSIGDGQMHCRTEFWRFDIRLIIMNNDGAMIVLDCRVHELPS
jgi:hypothetical protein